MDSQARRTFAGIERSVEAGPDATTLLHFRHLREAPELTQAIFAEVRALRSARHLLMKEGPLVEATISAAPSSTKNARQERAPQMPQTQKGHPWYFGRKARLGVDAPSGLGPRVTGTSANVADRAPTPAWRHGAEQEVHADAGYRGVEKRPESAPAPGGVERHVATPRGKVKALPEGLMKQPTVPLERAKAQVRARVAQPFQIVKNLFRHRQTRSRGLARNTAQRGQPLRLGQLGDRPALPAPSRHHLTGAETHGRSPSEQLLRDAWSVLRPMLTVGTRFPDQTATLNLPKPTTSSPGPLFSASLGRVNTK